MHIQQNFSLLKYNTFGIDVSCSHFIELDSEQAIVDFVKTDLQKFPEYTILGGGSNMLFTSDYKGLILKISARGIRVCQQENGHILVAAMAGEIWDEFVQYTVNLGYGGLENLSLIPGTVGASPIQNIGAYGVELCDVFHSLRALNISDGSIRTFDAKTCRFGYRDSFFKQEGKGQYIILEVTFRLDIHPVPKLDYGAIKAEIQKAGIPDESITVSDIREAVCSIRRSKLPDPELIGNAGSFFKNPVVGGDVFRNLLVKYPQIIAFPQKDDKFKLAAAWMIDQCGWKGYREKDAGVHVNQALVLVNYGQSSGLMIFQLAEQIIESVFQKFKIRIETEVNII